jgi:hypothetical protein
METLIIHIRVYKLKNETHVQFNEDVDAVFAKYNPQAIGIEPWYFRYKSALNNEIEALDFFRKSRLTGKIAEQDNIRDNIFRGFADSVKGATKHYDPAYREAANLLYGVFGHYGNIARKSLDDETAAINDFVRELNQPSPANAVALLGLSAWQSKLVEENAKFVELMSERYSETAQKTALRMKTTRIETDMYYQAIILQIENQNLIGIAVSKDFIRELNAVIERFRNILAQETGGRKPEPAPEKEP